MGVIMDKFEKKIIESSLIDLFELLLLYLDLDEYDPDWLLKSDQRSVIIDETEQRLAGKVLKND